MRKWIATPLVLAADVLYEASLAVGMMAEFVLGEEIL